ncbi:putative Coronin-like actin binding WD repeat protein, partial [Filobasidium floriforme]|uniref:putative Coronin-like actin binding WD repeat protein n=1 Tax=Filobasidium floriforme TaxID=5210 RepID=UPI001E8DBB79
MSRFVRPSKYRHTYSQQAKKEHNYENLKVSTSAWDTDLIKANPKFLSINYQASGGGAFLVLPLLSPFSAPAIPTPKLPDLLPLCRGHSGPVLDTAWHPHKEAVLASAGEDGKIFLWNFESEISNSARGSEGTGYSGKFSGWGEENWTTPSDWEHTAFIPKAGQGKKVGQVVFNPVASGLLASASGDHVVRLWDVDSGKFDEALVELKGHKDTVQSVCWNYTGDLLITTSRDKQIRMYDPRAGSDPIKQADGHGGIKGSRVVWLGDRERAVTTGFSRMSDRQMILWDTATLKPISTENIDSSSGVIMPHYVEGNSVLLLAGKGDGNIRYYEYADDELFYLNEHKSADPQRGFTLLPRHAVDVGQNEIARGFKLTTSTVEPIGFVVPRKAESFQADIFPPAPSDEAAFTAKEWMDGKKGPPKLIDMES